MNARLIAISDDDICSNCRHCNYNPGELSFCKQGWPGIFDDNLYVVECDNFRRKDMSQDFPYLEDQVTDHSTLFPNKDIHLVGAMGAFYGTLIGFHPDLAAEIVRRYQALDERHSVLFVGVDDDEESAAARRLLERGGKFEVIVRPVGQRDELVNALSKAAGTLHDLKNNWPLDELHEPIEATIDRACTLIPGLKEELA